jgi:hypothetical protein
MWMRSCSQHIQTAQAGSSHSTDLAPPSAGSFSSMPRRHCVHRIVHTWSGTSKRCKALSCQRSASLSVECEATRCESCLVAERSDLLRRRPTQTCQSTQNLASAAACRCGRCMLHGAKRCLLKAHAMAHAGRTLYALRRYSLATRTDGQSLRAWDRSSHDISSTPVSNNCAQRAAHAPSAHAGTCQPLRAAACQTHSTHRALAHGGRHARQGEARLVLLQT